MAFSLKDYNDLKEIGQGGMALVYKATHKVLKRTVAIKKLAVHLANREDFIKRFENEAIAAASLDHENVIRIFDFGMDSGSFYIAMEYIDGVDLEALLKNKKCPREIGLMIMLQALKGLLYASRKGIIHRDVKPANILISNEGRVKVLDFGLAYLGESIHLTSTNAVMGTPQYMSPEQAKAEKIRDGRMDIFSCGVILYRILTGVFPFTGDNIPSILHNIIYVKEKPVFEIVPTLPDYLAENISLSLEKDLDQRLTTLSPMIDSIQRYIFELGIHDPLNEITAFVNSQNNIINKFFKLLSKYHFGKGKEFSESGELSKSKAHFKEAIKNDPSNKEASKYLEKMKNVESSISKKPTQEDKAPASSSESQTAPAAAFSLSLKNRIIIGAAVFVIGAIGLISVYINNSRQDKQLPAAAKTHELPRIKKEITKNTDKTENKQAKKIIKEMNGSAKKTDSVVESPLLNKKTAAVPKSNKQKEASAGLPAEGILKASIVPEYSDVYLDNQKIPVHWFLEGLKLSPKRYKISARALDYEPYETIVQVSSGHTRNLSINLKPLTVGFGSIHIHSKPWAELYIDGERKGITPTKSPISLSAGKHEVELKRSGFKVHKQTVRISRDMKIALKVTLEKL
ncbi:MAG: serine/threonine-protein kinase [bacterium]